ncbi:MAG: LTA synthase family protein [Eubacterium sp.]|nr:LTA synthase family protein [Eubacterium sp.]
MFIILASISALLMAVVEIYFFTREKTAGSIIRIILKNLFTVDLLSLAFERYVMKYQHFLDTSGYDKINFLKFFWASIFIGVALQFIFALFNGFLFFEPHVQEKRKHGARAVKVISTILFALGCAAYFGTIWGKGAFGDVTGDQLIVNLTSPTEGTEASVYIDGFEGPVFQTLLCTTVFALIDFAKFKVVYKNRDKIVTIIPELCKRLVCLALAIVMLVGGVSYGYKEFSLRQVINAYLMDSEFLEETYVDAAQAKVTFPEKKRNLIHIYLESYENSYLSKDLGGFMDTNLMPELTELAETGIIFSDTESKFGGPIQGTGTNWSIASMINQTTGLPMKTPGKPNDYGSPDKFLPGAYALGDMLEAQGYEQTVMIGSSASFGGLGYYYNNHGNWTVFDYNYAIENGYLPEGYKVWWGFEDDKLYEFAKAEITRLYETGKPFNFTVENADTHRPGGYIGENTPTPYENSYANAVAYSSSEVVKFVQWIQSQPFYENTTIVLIGDHLSMETDFFEFYGFTPEYERRQFNLILNPDPSVANVSTSVTTNRLWSNWDLYPTILASIGAKIDGERLGIGTNLFSGDETVFEQYGVDFVNAELEKASDLYTNEILGGQTELDEEQARLNHHND